MEPHSPLVLSQNCKSTVTTSVRGKPRKQSLSNASTLLGCLELSRNFKKPTKAVTTQNSVFLQQPLKKPKPLSRPPSATVKFSPVLRARKKGFLWSTVKDSEFFKTKASRSSSIPEISVITQSTHNTPEEIEATYTRLALNFNVSHMKRIKGLKAASCSLVELGTALVELLGNTGCHINIGKQLSKWGRFLKCISTPGPVIQYIRNLPHFIRTQQIPIQNIVSCKSSLNKCTRNDIEMHPEFETLYNIMNFAVKLHESQYSGLFLPETGTSADIPYETPRFIAIEPTPEPSNNECSHTHEISILDIKENNPPQTHKVSIDNSLLLSCLYAQGPTNAEQGITRSRTNGQNNPTQKRSPLTSKPRIKRKLESAEEATTVQKLKFQALARKSRKPN